VLENDFAIIRNHIAAPMTSLSLSSSDPQAASPQADTQKPLSLLTHQQSVLLPQSCLEHLKHSGTPPPPVPHQRLLLDNSSHNNRHNNNCGTSSSLVEAAAAGVSNLLLTRSSPAATGTGSGVEVRQKGSLCMVYTPSSPRPKKKAPASSPHRLCSLSSSSSSFSSPPSLTNGTSVAQAHRLVLDVQTEAGQQVGTEGPGEGTLLAGHRAVGNGNAGDRNCIRCLPVPADITLPPELRAQTRSPPLEDPEVKGGRNAVHGSRGGGGEEQRVHVAEPMTNRARKLLAVRTLFLELYTSASIGAEHSTQ